MSVRTLTIDGKLVSARAEQTVLEAARDAGIDIPTLCHLDGVHDVGACRLCLVELGGSGKLVPACVTAVAEEMVVRTDTEQLREYRKMIVELLFAERNHVCAVCVANGACELQDLARINQLRAVGVSEAPRGTLFHEYEVDENGLLRRVNLIIATSQNSLAINRTILQIARRFVEGPKIPEGVLNRIEAGVRAFDPCLSCATHAFGKMPLDLRLVRADGTLLDRRVRGSS